MPQELIFDDEESIEIIKCASDLETIQQSVCDVDNNEKPN